MTIPTVASLRANARRLDYERLRREQDRKTAAEVIALMRDHGCSLRCTFGPARRIWSLSNGTWISEGAAAMVRADAHVVACDPGLFLGATPQTWRWCD